MGIPGFFGWILKKYNRSNITSTAINHIIDEFYIDANCLIHPSCMKVLDVVDANISDDELEDKMIKTCIEDLHNLIRIVNPQKKLFIAIDGVAPMAKITQQRKRRYKAYDEQIQKDSIRRKFNMPLKKKWSNASITPATVFMEKLHLQLLDFLNTLKMEMNTHLEIIYSSYHTAGEGEHKIFEYIKKNNTNTQVFSVVYGLDADLIFLAMASQRKNIYLIRESVELGGFQSISPYTYVSIDNLIERFNELIDMQIVQECHELGIPTLKTKNYINDIIFICYLLGNDFIPHIPSIDIKHSGMEMLLAAYVNTYIKHQKLLVELQDIAINMLFFDDLLAQLAIYEKEYFEKYDENFLPRVPIFKNKCDEELWKFDNMINIPINDVFKRHIGTFEDWKYRYYEKNVCSIEAQETCVDDMCLNYLSGIMWIAKYYFGNCVSWSWMYNYEHAPFIVDLNKYMKTYHLNLNAIQYELSKPLNPILQLLCVIPIPCNYLLPQEYANLMTDENSPIGDMFPSKFEIDTANKTMYWQCIPILPLIDLKRLREIKVKDMQLNMICDNFIVKATR